MARDISSTAERMAKLPADIPRDAVIVTRNLQREYVMGTERVRALQGVDLVIRRNELWPSWPLRVGQVDDDEHDRLSRHAVRGRVLAQRPPGERTGRRLAGPDPEQGDRFRLPDVQPLPRASALANVGAADGVCGVSAKERRERARTTLEQVGLGNRVDHRPNELSGGQRQRVAVARALVNRPSILLADEPTGNLDSSTSQEIMALFETLYQQGQTIILVTHEPDIAEHAKRQVVLRDGRVSRDSSDPSIGEAVQ